MAAELIALQVDSIEYNSQFKLFNNLGSLYNIDAEGYKYFDSYNKKHEEKITINNNETIVPTTITPLMGYVVFMKIEGKENKKINTMRYLKTGQILHKGLHLQKV